MIQNNPDILINNDNNYLIPKNIVEVINSTLVLLKLRTNISISIAFIDENEMIELNNHYNGYAQPTDVLSFDSQEIDPESGLLFLGDIVICFPYIQNQSANLGNNLQNEILLMVIHGLLHLSGYDHNNEKNKVEMWNTQNNILKSLNIEINKLPE